ncbi:carbamoyltransferase HypF [Caulobacter sp. S45]|uniref:carbamoyltransferase HypF n=1 Tax=Caulobacter sp. S45 TaxID=1641861 RepID=UPI00131E2B7F|nr:carbamoyltransferase HypF [Caulobacter sp. S45]
MAAALSIAAEALSERRRLRVRGAVQGVGFRPFVHRLALRYELSGFVLNDSDGVLIEVEGVRLDAFIGALEQEPPPLARIDSLEIATVPSTWRGGFEIRESIGGRTQTRIVPDAGVCSVCLEDLFDPSSRFHLYPLVTCTDCGPRFTIVRALPYDRARTAMATFPPCEACACDYADTTGRRFHAETIACPACGPSLSHPIETIAEALAKGRIVALKGIGGFHLMCDARNETAVAELRRRKRRDAKPFAVMVANPASVDQIAVPSAAEHALMALSARPVVLLRRREGLAPSVAPRLDRLGVMLPYAPVHHLVFHAMARGSVEPLSHSAAQPTVLVATSANLGGEPLIIDDEDARRQLAGVADLTVTHDRQIVVRTDDSVMAVIAGAPAYLRRARGFVPEPIELKGDGPPALGAGGLLKATVTVVRGREAFVSQHIGDLRNAATISFYEETARRLLETLDVRPEAIGCDLHPDFPSTRFAARLAQGHGARLVQVQHHVAHIAAVAAEHRLTGPVLGVALDGHGLGADGGAWGGELVQLDGADWVRLGHLAPLPLPGGDRAAREPWRMGVAALTALGRADEAARWFADIPLAVDVAHLCLTPAGVSTTTSMGRLFDAAAALLGVCPYQSYEAQAAMELQALVRTPRVLPDGYRLAAGVLDFRPLLATLPELRSDPVLGAELFHGVVVQGLTAWIAEAASRRHLKQVALGGGCLMNAVLAEGLSAALRDRGLEPWLPRAAPANDGGLSLGQAALARIHAGHAVAS